MCRKDVTRYRTLWMGLAILWTLYYHIPIGGGIPVLSIVKDMGYGGADLFIFASGLGCYRSLEKDRDAGRFFKRRIQRLAPCYLPFALIWIAYKLVVDGLGYRAIIGNLFAIEYFAETGPNINWYMSALLLLYVLAPYLHSYAEKATPGKHAVMLLLLLALSVPFWGNFRLVLIFTRLPLFYVGMVFSKFCQGECRLGRKAWFISAAALAVGLGVLAVCLRKIDADTLWLYGLYWYPFLLIAPAGCLLTALLADRLERVRVFSLLRRAVECLGRCSLEIYLLHVLLFEIVRAVISRFGMGKYATFIWLFALVLLAVSCFLFRYIEKWVGGLLLRPSKKQKN